MKNQLNTNLNGEDVLAGMLNCPINDKRKKFYHGLIAGQYRNLKIYMPQASINRNRKPDLKIINQKNATLPIYFAYNFIILAAFNSKGLMINLELDNTTCEQTNQNIEKNLVQEFILRKKQFEQKFVVHKDLHEHIISKTTKNGIPQSNTIQMQLNFSDFDKCPSTNKKLQTFTLIIQLLKYFNKANFQYLKHFRLKAGRQWKPYLQYFLNQIVNNSLLFALNPDNKLLQNLEIPVIFDTNIYDKFIEKRKEYLVEQSYQNQYYRIQKLKITQPYAQYNNQSIKKLLEGFLLIFPNLVSLKFDNTVFEQKSFQILADGLGNSNPLLQSLTIAKVKETNNKILALKNLIAKSPYLFQIHIDTENHQPKKAQQKNLTILAASKFLSIQRCLSLTKILKQQGFDINTSFQIFGKQKIIMPYNP